MLGRRSVEQKRDQAGSAPSTDAAAGRVWGVMVPLDSLARSSTMAQVMTSSTPTLIQAHPTLGLCVGWHVDQTRMERGTDVRAGFEPYVGDWRPKVEEAL